MPSSRKDGEDFTLGEIQRTLDRMDNRMERVIDDHEKRLRRVEKWVYILPPTMIVAGASILIAIIRGGP